MTSSTTRKRNGKQGELFGRSIEAAQWKEAIIARLEREGETEKVAKLRGCGLKMHLYCAECGHAHETATRCNRKWCPSCAPKRGNERAARLRVLIAAMRWPMHLTLTVPNTVSEHAPRSLLRDLMLSLRRLRRLKLWKTNVTGGLYSIEITDKGNGYHPHLHLVIDCRWLALHTPEPRGHDSAERKRELCKSAAQELQAAWQFATGIERHMSLWIRRCDADAAREIVKYALKSEDAVELQGRLGPVFDLLDSVRMCSPFGNVRGVKLPPDTSHKLTCPNGHSEWRTAPTPGRVVLRGRWEERRLQRIADRERVEAEAARQARLIEYLNRELRREL